MKVVLAKDTYNPKGLPDLWPREVFPDHVNVEKPFISMTDIELQEYKALHQADYDEWEANYKNQEKSLYYQSNRKTAYPEIGDQFDMLYKAMKAGILPEVTDFVSAIDAVKEQYPKP